MAGLLLLVDLSLAALLLITTTALVGLAADMLGGLGSIMVGMFSGSVEFFRNTTGFLATTVDGLAVLLSLGSGASLLLLVRNIIMCRTGCCCFVATETVAGRFRGRPRLRDDTACNVSLDTEGDCKGCDVSPSPDDEGFKVFFSTNSR